MKSRTKSIILIILIALTIAFIFSNSIPSKDVSRERSGVVKEIVEPILELAVGDGNVTDHLVRKLAHFAEFFVLGAALCLLSYAVLRRKNVIVPMFTYMTVALCDETIQLFTGRGSQVSDVWLDIFGATVGFFVCFGIAYLMNKHRNEKSVERR